MSPPLTPAPRYTPDDPFALLPNQGKRTKFQRAGSTPTTTSSSDSSPTGSVTLLPAPRLHDLRPISTMPVGSGGQRMTAGAANAGGAGGKRKSTVADLYAFQDEVMRLCPNEERVNLGSIIPVAEQSAGKSSVLSSLLDTALPSSGRLTTAGPFRIMSRKNPNAAYTATIDLILPEAVEGLPVSFRFAGPVTDKEELGKMLSLAGMEARKPVDEGDGFRSYDELVSRTSDKLQKEAAAWPVFTHTVILVRVSGPQQPFADIIDLPGLVDDDNGPLVRSIVERYVSNPNNLLLACLAAGGSDTVSTSGALKLVMKHDSTGERTLGVVTKADQITEPLEDAYGDLILGNAKALKGWKPRYGWHPFRARSGRAIEKTLSDEAFQAKVAELYAGEDWKTAAEQVGRKFGNKEVRMAVAKASERLKRQSSKAIQGFLRTQHIALLQEEERMPPIVAEPVAEVHDCLLRIQAALHAVFGVKAVYSQRLYGAQQELGRQLRSTIPIFVPTICKSADGDITVEREGNIARLAAVDLVMPECSTDGRAAVGAEELFEAVKLRTHPRTKQVEEKPIRLELLHRHVSGWSAICANHIRAVWVIVGAAVDQVVGKDVCRDKPNLAARIVKLLTELGEKKISATTSFALKLCAAERTDPELTNVRTDRDEARMQAAAARLVDTFTKTRACGPDARAADTVDEAASPADSRLQWTDNEIAIVSRIIASTTLHLDEGADRISSNVGRAAQQSVWAFVDECLSTLRAGMGLEQVQHGVKRRLADYCEPDEETCKKRDELKDKRRVLSRISAEAEKLHQ